MLDEGPSSSLLSGVPDGSDVPVPLDGLGADDPMKYFAPDGTPWCRFAGGSCFCVNKNCLNPNHRVGPS